MIAADCPSYVGCLVPNVSPSLSPADVASLAATGADWSPLLAVAVFAVVIGAALVALVALVRRRGAR